LRQDLAKFQQRNAVILVVAPESLSAVQQYWQQNNLPFTGLADPEHTVAKRYQQEVNLLKLGRMPAVMVIDPRGQVRYSHYGQAMMDIPPNSLVLSVIDEIARETA
jgi:peroxiredoxin Q/BCP